ncbi:transposase family protein [Siphonobacter sp. SORGH_AS_1065]|uniref:transposase family protein n=1 Tax=Siphonobacter sp. SORGH_AS_1065 TaxID=3041795 RepID=UPI0027808CA5|nr:transposase family protein [Siphonobacter sp. SORGH_AS_1065]MDQ1090071.1 hypothetical protein [Siphonobacter sp. SORGH_AS_1065]
MSIYTNLLSDKQYRASTGLNKDEFDQLYVAFKDLYIPRKENPYKEGKGPFLTDKRQALFFILHYLKAYPTLVNRGLYFGCSEKTASNLIDLLKPVLQASYQKLGINIPRHFKDDKSFTETFPSVSDVIIDVTEIETSGPQNNDSQKNNYSGKKKA